jgi:beta-glucosidase-like glycosyl hydrolase/CubicO group peptidase (beta-lactamase class C family)
MSSFDNPHSFVKSFICRGIFILICSAGFLAGCAHPPVSEGERTKALASKSEWVESTLTHLSLQDKIAQMIMPSAFGYYYSDQSEEYRRVEKYIKTDKFGGLAFFQGDVYETAVMTNRLQKLSDLPLLISADFEWGAAMRIRRSTRFPEEMALGATRDTALVREMGIVIGQEARAIGVQQVYAPVSDVNVNPDNPVINTRSFGENPELVAELASAYAEGLQEGGVIATAKHFPGHGDTKTDSHIDLPLISVSRGRLDSVELVPFKRLIQYGVGSVMVAHLLVPALESDAMLPSTLSPSIVSGTLEKELGFNGIVVTDAMTMGAVVNRFGADSAAIRAVLAGVDIVLMPPNPEGALAALTAAVQSGTIPEERILKSVRKILSAKWDLGLVNNRAVNLDNISSVVETPEHLQLAKRLAREAITVLKDSNVLPLKRYGSGKVALVIVTDVDQYRTEINRPTNSSPNEPVGDYLVEQMRRRSSNITVERLDPTSNELDFGSIVHNVKNAETVVCAVYSKARSGSGKFGLPDSVIIRLDSLTHLGKKSLVIAMGSPYVLAAVPNADAYVCSYSDAEALTEATVEAVYGEIPTTGKIPVSIPGMFVYGTGLEIPQAVMRNDQPESQGFNRDSLAVLDSIITRAIRDSAFPGAQLLVAKDGGIVYNKSFGRFEYSPSSAKVTNATMYDLASVTKVIATTSAIMKLYEDGKLNLDDKVTTYVPEFGVKGKESVSVRNLLLHNGGLPPFKRLYLTCKTPQEVLDSVYSTELIYTPGDSTVYSDFDFIILGKIVEKITNQPLDRYVRDTFFEPLGMSHTMYLPPASMINEIAPTEYDSTYRKSLVRGFVHDENAYALGGVSGHAGLFSTASDLAIMMQMLMNGGSYGGKQYLKPETIKMFTTRQGKPTTRALGWDTKTMKGYSTAGSLFSEQSFGHTGFTGTSIWVDPTKSLFVIFLTNRVYPTRVNTKIASVRPKVHDAIVRALLK